MNTPNTTVGNKACEKHPIFQWSITSNGDNTWTITNKQNTNLVWDLTASQAGEGVAILAYAKHGGNNQRWYINSLGGNKYTINNKITNKCARPGPQGHWNWQYTCTRVPIDNWIIEEVVEGPGFTPYILNLDLSKPYILKSKKFGWCANVVGNNAQVSNKVCSFAANFQWRFVKNDDDNTYFITSVSNGNLVWDVSGSNMAEQTPILSYAKHGGPNQRFWIKSSNNGLDLQFVNKFTGKCARPGPYGHWDWSYTCTNDVIDFWGIEGLAMPTLNTNMHIINKWNGQCIFTNGGNQQLRFGACQRTNNFYWNIELNGANFFLKNALNLAQVFDVTASGVANGVKLLNWGRHGANNQRWLINMVRDNHYEIRNVNSNRCAQLQDNGDIVQWDCTQDDRQLFQIVVPGSNLFPLSGRLTDALTGQGFANQFLIDNEANITFTNTQSGQIYNGNIDYTNSSWTANLPNGTYDCVFSMNNYITYTFQIVVTGSSISTTIIRDLVISPVVQGMRAVLMWGDLPKDIDLYMEDAAGNKVYWNNKISGFMNLDVDDRNGQGPETITLKAGATGEFKVYVRNYSKDAPLSQSGSTCTINVGDKQIASVNIPTAEHPADNYIWFVGTYNATTMKFTLVNQVRKTL
jgi:hypothetical protein